MTRETKAIRIQLEALSNYMSKEGNLLVASASKEDMETMFMVTKKRIDELIKKIDILEERKEEAKTIKEIGLLELETMKEEGNEFSD